MKKETDEKYCSDCGAVIKLKAEICLKCGVRQIAPTITKSKSKVVAVLLAVFLSYWTWLYTYKHDGWKFWVGLISCIIGVFLLCIPNVIIMIWSIIDVAIKDSEWYNKY